MSDPFDISGRVALVTGAASGLGRAMADALAARGARVARLDAAPQPDGDMTLTADVTDRAAMAAAVAAVVARWGRLDICVANAGVSDRPGARLHETDPAECDRVLRVNLDGVLNTARPALAQMVAQGSGKLILVASMWGLAGPAGLYPRPAYAASKGAVVNLARELALEYARDGIQVNALCPGFFRTESRPRTEQAARAMAAYTPAGRIAAAEEIGGTVVYLAAPASDFVTGHALVIDGGVLAR